MLNHPRFAASSKDSTSIRRQFNIGIAAFIMVGCLLSAPLAYAYFHARYMERDVLTWPAVNATVLSGAVMKHQSKNGPWWVPLWKYTYTINGKVYESQSDSAKDGAAIRTFDSEDGAAQQRDSRAIGQQVTAYYDPNSPERSVLEKRVARDTDKLLLELSIFAFILSCIPAGVLALLKNRRLSRL